MLTFDEVDPSSTAVITIDMQHDFVHGDRAVPGTAAVVPVIARLLGLARERSVRIVHVVRLYLPDGSNAERCRKPPPGGRLPLVNPGSPGADIVPDLLPSPVRLDAELLLAGRPQDIGPLEHVIYKPRWGAFHRTALEEMLRSSGVDTLIFAGCNFPNCPRTSIYEASERDFRIALVADACSGVYERGRQELVNIGVSVVDIADVGRMLE